MVVFIRFSIHYVYVLSLIFAPHSSIQLIPLSTFTGKRATDTNVGRQPVPDTVELLE